MDTNSSIDGTGQKILAHAAAYSACPGCGCDHNHPLGSTAPPIVQMIGGVEFLQDAYIVCECSNCGLLYKTPTPKNQDLSLNYDLAPSNRYSYTQIQPTERVVLRLLTNLQDGACVLDFGCNTGRLLTFLPDHIVKHGFEINEEAAAISAGKGIHMVKAEDWENPIRPMYDAIVLVDVFEHLDSPATLLEKLWRSVKPGGLLILCTGNGDHWACRLDPGRFWYFRLYEHLCMITRRFGDHLAARLEVETTTWTTACHYKDSFRVRLRSHLAHTIFWLHRKSPNWIGAMLECLPPLQTLIRSDCPPTYACCEDHVVVAFRKK